MNFPPLTWFDWGALLGCTFAGLALIIGIVGYMSDVLHARYRRAILKEAREMVGVLTKDKPG